jgi:hypothetical protein
VNLRCGLPRLAIWLTVLWLVFWTFAYVLRPVASEDAPPLPAFSASTAIAVGAASVLGLPWVIAGFRPDKKTAQNTHDLGTTADNRRRKTDR